MMRGREKKREKEGGLCEKMMRGREKRGGASTAL
jgi:hypothetical protein